MTKPIPDEPVVPEGKDCVDNLKVGELDLVSRKLGVSVERAINEDVEGLKWRALAMLGWVWHRRQNAGAELDSWLDLEVDELTTALRMNASGAGEDEDDDEDPTESERE